jgi:hypothetical protein
MSTPVILADRLPTSTNDTPTSTRHVIIARAELRDRQRPSAGNFVIVNTQREAFDLISVPIPLILK